MEDMRKEYYSKVLVLQLVSHIESLALHNESLQNQLDKVDAVFVGTRFNWQGTVSGRIATLEKLIKEAN